MAAEPKRTAGDGRVLPPEIWTEILSRLPANSTLRCRSVCKSWYSLISCPNFISDYSVKNPNKNGKRVLLRPYDRNRGNVNRGIVRPFSSHDESFTESREHDEVPESFLRSNVSIAGSCNGLICLCKDESHDDVKVTTFLIWNPTIRKVVEVPSIRKVVKVPSYCPEEDAIMIPGGASYFGFGFDDKAGDYKVMCTTSAVLGGIGKNSDCSDVCEIFDLGKGVWRGISPPVHSWNVRGGTPECYLNGAVHWTGFRDIECSYRILLSFDMSDEIFREIRMPDWNGDNDDCGIATISLTFGGLIHVIAWKWRRNHNAFDVNEDCSVWAMKEYGVAESWTKLFNIDLQSAEVYQYAPPYNFHLWENGEVLIVHDLSKDEYGYDNEYYYWVENMEPRVIQELLLYNTESRKCKQLFSFTKRTSIKCLYEESLVLM